MCANPRGLTECPAFSSDYVNSEDLLCPRTSCAAWKFLLFAWFFCLNMEKLLQHSPSPPSLKCERQFRYFQPSIFLNKKILLHQEEYAYSGTWCLIHCIYCWQVHSCFLLFSFIAESCVSEGGGISGGCCSPRIHIVSQFYLLGRKLIVCNDEFIEELTKF